MYPPISSSIIKSFPNTLGWRQLLLDHREPYQGEVPSTISQTLINLIHISDTHICDAQSPARVEYLDRYADPHHPISKALGTLVGTYRAHESLSTQVFESMIQAINRTDIGPISKRKIDSVIITGDLTDNAQRNELLWFSALLKGEKIRPDSGSHTEWEGAGGKIYSPFYWNPHGTPKGERNDYPRELYGFPTIQELMHAVRAPFYASGINHLWLAVHGNHDALLQGTVAPSLPLTLAAQNDEKITAIADEVALQALSNVSEVGPASYPDVTDPETVTITADPSREFVGGETWVQHFYHEDEDNGLTSENLKKNQKYWRRDFEKVTILALDTVNPHGGWQGSIDETQFEWLKNQLINLRDRYVLISSHHPLQDLYNDYAPPGQKKRVTGVQIEELLIREKSVIAWLCGHTHRHRMAYFGPDSHHGFWQIETASLIDWPQQGRIVEIFLDQHEQVWIASTPINHAGSILPDPEHLKLDEVNELAGLSRLLSVNDWQRRGGIFSIENNEGTSFDRNAIVALPKRI
ncbi:MAG: TIGR03767 family metallophosphoesterase [Actinobacteria bacterium]|nr:TIGR03767 family metallophosphoesterase [Actinomycetota bacterium]NDE36660.1 TIGR03767 family metallophosphoesterase [Actinomycetota bacterium]